MAQPVLSGDELARVSREHPGWVITAHEDGSITACRDWHGSQQVFTVPGLAELERTLGNLPA